MTLIVRKYSEDHADARALITSHMNLVRKIAWHMHGRVSTIIDIEDLMQIGYIGLVDATQRYIPQEGIGFAAYAKIRIRGAIIDYLRSSSSMCRATIGLHQRMKAVTNKLEQKLLRAPTHAELAAEMRMGIDEFEKLCAQISTHHASSLDEVYTDQSMIFSDNSPSPEERLQHKELKTLLRLSLEDLPEREALLLQLYYVEELNIYEIAKIMEVTTGRISQIKKAAITRLRKSIAQRQGETI